jgi:uncharacterized membrane protein
MEVAAVRNDREVAAAAIPADPLCSLGRILYALPIVAFGLLHVALGDLGTRFAPAPDGMPGRSIAAYALGLALIGIGLAIVFDMQARPAALALAGLIALSLLFFYAPRIAARPGFGGAWTNPAKYLAILSGALLLANPDRGVVLGRFFLSLFFVLGGVQHFVYESFVVTLIPAWIPGHVFWSRFAGLALLAAGFGLWQAKTARLASILSGAMIFLWFILLHIPRALASQDPLEWSGVFESLAMSGIAFMLAGSPERGPAGAAG